MLIVPDIRVFYLDKTTRIVGTIACIVLFLSICGLGIYVAGRRFDDYGNTIPALVIMAAFGVALALSAPSLFRWKIRIDSTGITQEYGFQSRHLPHEDVLGFQRLPMGMAVQSRSGRRPIKFGDTTDNEVLCKWVSSNYPKLKRGSRLP